MTAYRVLRSQKNDLLPMIDSAGLDPLEFAWVTVPSPLDEANSIDKLVHSATGYFFTFDYKENASGDGHWARFSPGHQKSLESQYPGSWMNQLTYFKGWLTFLTRELDAPPLWEKLAQGSAIADSGLLDAAVDTPFTAEEQEAITRQIKAVRAYVASELPAGSVSLVNSRLDHLETSLTSQGRVSWVQLFLGLVTTLVWGGLMAPEQATLAGM